jgi:SAM-dependent methyltransferase
LHILCALGFWIASVSACLADGLLVHPAPDIYTQSDAEKFNQHAKGSLAPAYPYLADYLVDRYQLSEKPGIGIDLGSGPGDVIIELARRSRAMYWIDADINPHHFQYLFRDVDSLGLAHRVGAIFADAQQLPFRDGYADLVISRGSFQFWGNTESAFAEILRVLKPGGCAFVGRGLTPNTPLEVARAVRGRQGGGPRYDLDQTEAQFRQLMSGLSIETYEIIRPQPSADVNYGIWVSFAKPSGAVDGE